MIKRNYEQSVYSKKLLDPRWQKKRLEILQRDNWTCRFCESTDNTLHVHHIYYEPKSEPWDAELKHLITLCAECHQEETELLIHTNESVIKRLKHLGFTSKEFMDLDYFFFYLNDKIDLSSGGNFFYALEHFLSKNKNVDMVYEEYNKHVQYLNSKRLISTGESDLPF